MRLSVCIVNWNTRAHLRACLHALQTHPLTSMETLVVDNASSDGSADMVRSEFPHVHLLANTHNAGYAEGCNRAAECAQGDALLLLNPDVTVHRNTLAHALAFLDTHPRAAAVGIRLLSPNGRTQRSVRAFPDPLPVLWEAVGLAKLFPRSRKLAAYRQPYFNYNRAAPVDQPMASFLLIRRTAWDDTGPMDTRFPIFFNDVDWCWRAKRQHGWEIWYTPDALATHEGGASTRQRPGPMRDESHRALRRFYEKHYKQTLPAPAYALALALMECSRLRPMTAPRPPILGESE